MKSIRLFQTQAGKQPFADWLSGVKDRMDRARIRRRIDRLQLGHYGDWKKIDKNLSELRLFFGSGYRIYFTELAGEIIILLLGGDKRTQKRDIAKAKMYLDTLLQSGEYDE